MPHDDAKQLAAIKEAKRLKYQFDQTRYYENWLLTQANAERDKKIAADPEKLNTKNTLSVVKKREWYALPCSKATVSETMNIVEGMGFPVVNVISSGIDAFIVAGARVVTIEIPAEEPEEPEAPVDPETTAPVLGEADEDARRKWETENA